MLRFVLAIPLQLMFPVACQLAVVCLCRVLSKIIKEEEILGWCVVEVLSLFE